MEAHKIKKFLISTYRLNITLVILLIGEIVKLIKFLISSMDTTDQENTSEGDLTGVYNFRTRKYDNGTDPYGWYEEDL